MSQKAPKNKNDKIPTLKSGKVLQQVGEQTYAVFDNLLEGCQVIDFAWRYIYVNEVVAKHGKKTKEALLGHTMMEMYPGIENTEMFAVLRDCMENRVTHKIDNVFTYPDGTQGWFELSIQPVPEGVLVLSYDITSRIQAEKKTEQLKRLYATLSQVNQTIVRVDNRNELFQAICDVAVEFGVFTLAWIGLLEEKTGRVVPVAARGLDINDWPFPMINIRKGRFKNGLISTAIQTSSVVTSEDVQANPDVKSLHKQFQELGYHSSAVVPIHFSGAVIGILSLVSSEMDLFQAEDEMSLLEEMGLDISFALDTFETETKRRRAEEKIEGQNRRLQVLREIDVAILAADSIENIVGAALSHIRELIGCNRAVIALIDWKTNEVVVFDVKTTSESSISTGTRIPLLPYQDMFQTFSKNQPVLFKDLAKTPNLPPLFQTLKAEGLRSICMIPLFSQGSQIGAFNLSSEIPEFFDGEKIDLGREIANQVAIAITQNRLIGSLRKSEERFRSLYENATIGIYRTTPEGEILLANPALINMLGYSSFEELAQRNLEREGFNPGYERNEFRQQIERGGIVTGLESAWMRKDGGVIFVRESAKAIRDESGKVVHYEGTVEDVTLRKQAEDERASQARFPSENPEPVIRLRQDGIILYANEASQSLLEEWNSIVGDYAPDFWRDLAEVAYTDRTRKRIEVRHAEQTLSFFVVPVADTDYVNLYGRDITERVHAEQSLRESQERLAGIVHSTMDAMITLDIDQRIILFNPAAEQMFHCSADEVIGQSLDRFVPERYRAAHHEHVRVFGRSNQTKRSMGTLDSLTCLRANGEEFPAEITISQSEVGGQKIFTAFLRDSTERVHNERLQTAVYEIARATLSTQSLDELYAYIHEILNGFLPAKNFYIALYDQEIDLLTFPYFQDEFDDTPAPVSPGGSLTGYVLRTHTPLLATQEVVDELAEKGEIELLGTDSIEWLGAPLVVDNQSIGVMAIQSYNENIRFDKQDLDMMAYVSTQVASAIERKKAVDALQVSEQQFRSIFEQSPIGMALVDTHSGRFLQVNPKYCEIVGRTTDEMLTIDFTTITHPDDVGIEDEDRKKFVDGDIHSYNFDKRYVRPDQSIVWVRVTVAEFTQERKETMVNLSMVEDITERKQYVTELEEQIAERKQAENKIQIQLDRLRTLTEIDRVITSSMDMRVSFDILLGKMLSQLSVDAISILLFSPATQTLEYFAGMGFRTPVIRKTRLRLGEGVAGQAGLKRKVVHVSNFSKESAQFTRKDLREDDNFVDYFAVPLVAKGLLKGMLEIFNRTSLDPDPEWVGYLETLGGQAAIAIDSAQLFDGLQQSNLELVAAYDATIAGWSHAMDMRDKETEGHTQRVADLTMKLAKKMGVDKEKLIHIRRGALLHDIGKLGVPDQILLKPGELTEEEWELMHRHPIFAYEMLHPITYLRPALDIPYCHHEKWDGTGYPRGLSGEQIPLAARIFAVVDVWDALRSDRPYRLGWSREKTLDYIRGQSGKHFDPKVVDTFLTIIDES